MLMTFFSYVTVQQVPLVRNGNRRRLFVRTRESCGLTVMAVGSGSCPPTMVARGQTRKSVRTASTQPSVCTTYIYVRRIIMQACDAWAACALQFFFWRLFDVLNVMPRITWSDQTFFFTEPHQTVTLLSPLVTTFFCCVSRQFFYIYKKEIMHVIRCLS